MPRRRSFFPSIFVAVVAVAAAAVVVVVVVVGAVESQMKHQLIE